MPKAALALPCLLACLLCLPGPALAAEAAPEAATAATAAPAPPDAAPATLVEWFHGRLLEVMQTDGYAERVAALQAPVAATFDDQTISRISLGRQNWQGLSQAQQGAYAALMRRLIVTTYAARFDGYSGQTFETLEESPLPRDRAQVRSLLHTGSDQVSLDYQLLRQGSVWRVYDVVAEGVSDLSLKRSIYSAAFKAGGFQGAQSEISATIRQNETGSAE